MKISIWYGQAAFYYNVDWNFLTFKRKRSGFPLGKIHKFAFISPAVIFAVAFLCKMEGFGSNDFTTPFSYGSVNEGVTDKDKLETKVKKKFWKTKQKIVEKLGREQDHFVVQGDSEIDAYIEVSCGVGQYNGDPDPALLYHRGIKHYHPTIIAAPISCIVKLQLVY